MITRKRAMMRAGTGAAIFALAVVAASFPMRLALDMGDAAKAGLTARAVSGSIWSGHMAAAKWGPLDLGNVDLALSPASLLGGTAAMSFRRVDSLAPNGLGVSGVLFTGANKGWRDVNGRFDVGMRLGGLTMAYVDMRDAAVRFNSLGQCTEAAGQVQAALTVPIGGFTLPQGMSGTLRCMNGQAHIALTSQSGMEVLEAELGGQGAWKARFLVKQVAEPAMVNALSAMGFRPHGDAYLLNASGQL